MPSMVTLTTRSPSSPLRDPAEPMICTPMLTVVCCPNRTIFVPARQSQQTKALSAPAETRFFEESATARMPLRWPASCCRGVKVSEEKRWTRLERFGEQRVRRVPSKIYAPNVMEADNEHLCKLPN